MISLIWQVVIGLGLLLRKMKGRKGVAFPWKSVWERSLNKGRSFLKLSFHLVAVPPNLLSFLQLCPSTITSFVSHFSFPLSFSVFCVIAVLCSLFWQGFVFTNVLAPVQWCQKHIIPAFCTTKNPKNYTEIFLPVGLPSTTISHAWFYWVNSVGPFATQK